MMRCELGSARVFGLSRLLAYWIRQRGNRILIRIWSALPSVRGLNWVFSASSLPQDVFFLLFFPVATDIKPKKKLRVMGKGLAAMIGRLRPHPRKKKKKCGNGVGQTTHAEIQSVVWTTALEPANVLCPPLCERDLLNFPGTSFIEKGTSYHTFHFPVLFQKCVYGHMTAVRSLSEMRMLRWVMRQQK